MSSVAIQDRRVTVADLSGMVKNNDLSGEVLSTGSGLVLRVGGDVSTLDVLDGDVLDVEANVVAGNGLGGGTIQLCFAQISTAFYVG